MIKRIIVLTTFILISNGVLFGQHTIARIWNEVLLEAIRNDLARPTVHARNLFHIHAAMYDAWAALEEGKGQYLLGNTLNGFNSPFDRFTPVSSDLKALQIKAISYSTYRLLYQRFEGSPEWPETKLLADSVFKSLGYDPSFHSMDYSQGSAAALGNYIAEQYIQFGHLDGANEQSGYSNTHYNPVNEFLNPSNPGNPNISDPNRWQPLAFDLFIDQSGNVIPGEIPEFLSPEWGDVYPFSLTSDHKDTYDKEGDSYHVFLDPGSPPFLDGSNSESSELYKWGFSLVSIWSSHLDPKNPTTIDISPKSLGNISFSKLPTQPSTYSSFYDLTQGGDISEGYDINPITNTAYESQIVKLGDYARVLAEFWADGPDSETPPGHWFTILNYVNDAPELEKRIKGEGDVVDDLEWDVVAYFVLGGAMHDCAIAAWSIKGYYDYIRPISAIRYMADQGQSSDPTLPNYHPEGIPLVDGYVELVNENDSLVGSNNEHLNKIKVFAWRGPDFIPDPTKDIAGVGWILAENWWPYQRPTFVTPPFAGYVSGHSTYSRAAAEVLTELTGSSFFPGGLGEFKAPAGEFLVFEDGPSEDIFLQWATYQDASDQCSLSRIWGGIHPPADDIPGRIIGYRIGKLASKKGLDLIYPLISSNPLGETIELYPNPAQDKLFVQLPASAQQVYVRISDGLGRLIYSSLLEKNTREIDIKNLSNGTYYLELAGNKISKRMTFIKD